MPDVLFFELISNEENRDRCFRKLPEGETPLVLLPGLGDLMKMEVRNNRPCGCPSHTPEVERYQFNKKLGRRQLPIGRRTAGARRGEADGVKGRCGGLGRARRGRCLHVPATDGRKGRRPEGVQGVREQLTRFYAQPGSAGT